VETLVKFWIPVGAIVISIISLLISLSNIRFNKRYEAAKKRTEMLSFLVQTMTACILKRDQMKRALEKCEDILKKRKNYENSPAKVLIEKARAEVARIGRDWETVYKSVEELDCTDPIRMEQYLAHVKMETRLLSASVNAADTFISYAVENAQKWDKMREKTTEKDTDENITRDD